ncbi:hypothetical protein A2U01_0101491, partial [Trifolium medium]|nr:hypothetical protein [Trifolium medium]
ETASGFGGGGEAVVLRVYGGEGERKSCGHGRNEEVEDE